MSSRNAKAMITAVFVAIAMVLAACSADSEDSGEAEQRPAAEADGTTSTAEATPTTIDGPVDQDAEQEGGASDTGVDAAQGPGSAGVVPDGAEPNVLLIILDDIGLDHFPGYLTDVGFDKATMPTIEGLMEAGHVFENLQTYPTCSPTRASLLTGRHGVETGVIDAGRTSLLDTGFQSIQSELRARAGDAIATGVFGKWHLVGGRGGDLLDHPNQFGIDHYAGILTGNHESYDRWDKVTNGVASTSDTYSTTAFTDDAIGWIDEQEGQWFTWLAYTAPHSPVHLPPAGLHTRDDLTGTDQDLRRNGDAYFQAMLESVDTEIGRLLDSLDGETRANTFVMVIGDNGTGGRTAQEPYASIGAKGSLQVGGINTPMIVHNPYAAGDGRRHEPLISTIDFFPTVLDLFDLGPAPDDLAGNSFAPLITGSADAAGYEESDHVFSQNLETVAVRSQRHKLIRFDNGDERFHEIDSDPFEQIDLLATGLESGDQAEYERLSALLDRYLEGDYGA